MNKTMTREEAIQNIKRMIGFSDTLDESISTLFPELKESEDERIRMALCDIVRDVQCMETELRAHGLTVEKTLAYLEKQKEQKDYHKLYEDIDKYGWFRKEYIDKRIDEEFEQKKQKPINNSTREKIISRATSEKQVVLISESSGEAEIGWDTRSLEDAKRLLEDGLAFINDLYLSKNSINPAEKQKEQKDFQAKVEQRMEYLWDKLPDAHRVEKGNCTPEEWKTLGAYMELEMNFDKSSEEEQKPSINLDQLKSMMLQYLQEAANEKDDSDIEADTDKWARMILRYDFEQESAEWEWPNLSNCIRNCKKCHGKCLYRKEPYEEKQPAEWSKEDEKMLRLIINAFRNGAMSTIGQEQWLKSLPERFNLQPKQGWNGDDNVLLNNIINIIQNKKYVNDDAARKIYVDFLKSLRPKHEIYKEKAKEPKHTEVWVEGRTIFEQDANTFVNTEGESEAKLTGWVARDEDEKIWVYETCPEKYSDWQQWVGNDGSMRLDQKSFPGLKWEDEPVEVEITIRKK